MSKLYISLLYDLQIDKYTVHITSFIYLQCVFGIKQRKYITTTLFLWKTILAYYSDYSMNAKSKTSKIIIQMKICGYLIIILKIKNRAYFFCGKYKIQHIVIFWKIQKKGHVFILFENTIKSILSLFFSSPKLQYFTHRVLNTTVIDCILNTILLLNKLMKYKYMYVSTKCTLFFDVPGLYAVFLFINELVFTQNILHIVGL